ncbi:hypothetical protein Tco_0608555 [Tanacetum coccineum]
MDTAYPLPLDTAYPTFLSNAAYSFKKINTKYSYPFGYVIMTKVIKGEFEKLESVKISNVSLTSNTSLEIFNEEFIRMSRMEDDLFTYEVEIDEVTNILCDLKKEDDTEQ